MKLINLAGKEVSVHLVSDPNDSPSGLHLRARALLALLYPFESRLEEVAIPDSRLRLDFFLPRVGLIIEVQGEQHSKENGFFHQHVSDFVRQKIRDGSKRKFAELNNFTFVELFHDESDIQWSDRIREATGNGAKVGRARQSSGLTELKDTNSLADGKYSLDEPRGDCPADTY